MLQVVLDRIGWPKDNVFKEPNSKNQPPSRLGSKIWQRKKYTFLE